MTDRIETHVWRPATAGGHEVRPYAERPCVYMACDRPLSEHVFPAVNAGACPCPVLDVDSDDRDVCLCGHYCDRHDVGGGACRAVLP